MKKIPFEAGQQGRRAGIPSASSGQALRLRMSIRFVIRPASLRMMVILVVVLSATAWGTTYYVSSSSGSDSKSGTSTSAAWATIAHVNAQAFQPGDAILFKRGDVWNESLVPPSSGTSGNPITFDAYGTGAAPNFTGYYAIPSSAWVNVTGNAWKAPVPSAFTAINFCLFGTVWGQKVGASSSNLTAPWDFYLASGNLYVYSVGNPGLSYPGAIVPMALTNTPVINVNGKTWLVFQHFLVNWFDDYGVYVQGASDHLVFANMEADSLIPQGTQPLGFYVNESAPGPSDLKIYNSEAHLNYDGYRFDGAATAITMVNDKAYANRDGALVDNTSAVTYSNCHFYASSLAVAGSTDVEWTTGTGPIAGVWNVPADTPAAVQMWQRYPAEVTLTVDDIGMTPNADTYYAGQVLPVAQAAGVPVGVAITVGYSSVMLPAVVSEIQGWINSGIDVTSHSVSHTYYTNTNALTIQYKGSGTAAALTIGGTPPTLTIAVTGASDGVSCSLAQSSVPTWTATSCGTVLELMNTLNATGKFTATLPPPPCQGPYGTGCSAYTAAALLSQDLASVTGQDVKTNLYTMQLNVPQLTTDEIALSRLWMAQNLTGLPSTPVYVYPGGYETPTMQGIAAAVPYSGARGALKEDLGVKDTYASGFDVQNVTSFGVNPSWMGSQGAGVTAAQLQQKIQALVWKQQVWGVPWAIFWHNLELVQNDPVGGTEITNLIQDFQNAGAVVQTNTSLVNWLMAGTLETGTDGNFYYKLPAAQAIGTNGGVDFRPTENSPVVDAGQNLGSQYAIDINGTNQNNYGTGWEIGAHVYQAETEYGESNPPVGMHFTVGGSPTPGFAQLPVNWVNEQEMTAPSGTYDVTRAGQNTFALLQQAICDWAAAPDQWWLVQVPHGTVIDTGTSYSCTGSGPYAGQSFKTLTLLAKIVNGGLPAKFMVFDSDTPLLYNQTVCAHGITDFAGSRQAPSGDISTWWTGGNNGCADDIGSMWTLEGNWTSGNNGMVIQAGSWDATTNLGPSHYAFRDVELRPIATNAGAAFPVNTNVDPNGILGLSQTMQMASHIHFQNVYGHGDGRDWCATATGSGSCVTSSGMGGPGNNKISTFLNLPYCVYCSVTYSYFDYITSSGNESHVVSVTGTPGPLKIAHNWMSGGSIAIFTGGVAVMNPLYYLYDVQVTENRLTNPPTWVGTNYGGAALVLKSRLEYKACDRCLIDGNVVEYSDTTGGQSGQCLTFNSRNCSAGAICDNYQALLQDLTVTNNVCRHAVTGILLSAKSNYPGQNGGGATQPLRRLNVINNLFYDIGNSTVYDPTYVVNHPYITILNSGGENFICNGSTVSGGNKMLNCVPGTAGLKATGISPGDMFSLTNCADSTWNVPNGSLWTTRGAIAGGGTNPNGLTIYFYNAAAVSATTTGCVVGNGMGGAPQFNVTHNTMVLETALNKSTAGGKIYSGNDMQFWTDTGCTGGGPTNATTISAISRDVTGTMVTATVASTAGWAANLTGGTQTLVEVTGSGDFNGTFYYLGISGGNLQWMQTGTANEAGTAGGTAQQMGTCPGSIMNQSTVWKDNLVATDIGTAASCPNTGSSGWNGWVATGSAPVEGCPSGAASNNCSENMVDVTNSTVTNTDFPGRCAAKYMEVGGANANAIPPVTLTFPATTVCAGATADATCVGMAGMMSGAAFNMNDTNYHNYELAASSQYKAGGANAADDGTDLGANIAVIDNAETRSLYVCGTPCGAKPSGDPMKIEILAPGAGQSVTAVNQYLKPSPYINAIVYPLWWACSDEGGGVYSWANFDNQVTSDGWVAAGKKIIVVLGGVTYGGTDSICYGGGGWGATGVGNYATPSYVWTALGQANYATCSCNGQNQQIPNYFNSAYLTNYKNWVQATLAHLASSSYGSSIQYVRVAWGKGGETTPVANFDAVGNCPDGNGNNTLTTDWGYTVAGWESFLQGGMTFEAGLGSPLQLMISITPMGPSGGSQATVPNFTAPIAASLHIGFGTQGLMASDVNNFAGCGGNWCQLFATYAGKVPLETQTFYQSCPETNESGTCPSMAVTTGPLDPLLGWAAANQTTSLEMYYEDACAMLCPGYNQAGYAAYPQQGYLAAMMAAE